MVKLKVNSSGDLIVGSNVNTMRYQSNYALYKYFQNRSSITLTEIQNSKQNFKNLPFWLKIMFSSLSKRKEKKWDEFQNEE